MENNKEIQNRKQLLKSKRLLLLFSITLLLSSCATSNTLSVGDNRYYDLYCVKILNDNEVLAVYERDGHYRDDAKIITYGEHYSEWQKIRGDFTCVDFWPWVTAQGEIRIIPVIVKTSDYEKYKKGH